MQQDLLSNFRRLKGKALESLEIKFGEISPRKDPVAFNDFFMFK